MPERCGDALDGLHGWKGENRLARRPVRATELLR